MNAKQFWVAGIAILLLGGFQLYGLAELSNVPLPTASIAGTLYSDYTMKPLPNTMLEIRHESEFLTEEPEFQSTQQGWLERQYGTPSRWQVYTDSQGRFQLSGLPAGNYSIQCRAKVHTLKSFYNPEGWVDGRMVNLVAGQRYTVELWATPYREFLDAIHPQSVYMPDEPLRVGVRGFLRDDRYQMRVFAVKVDPRDARCYNVLYSLGRVRYGWWEGIREWGRYLYTLEPSLALIEEKLLSVRGRDVEGVFTQYLSLPRLEEGTYLVEIRSASIVRPLLVTVSSVGIVAKSALNKTEAWCVNLRTGQPVAGIPISQVKMGATSSHDSTLAHQARSDTQGLVRFQPQAQAYLVAQHPRTGRVTQWVEARAYDDSEGAQITGALYTERPIYRPGQTVHFKGILRQHTSDGYQLLREGTPIRVEVRQPNYEVIWGKTFTLNELSSFHGEFTTQPDDPTGFYEIAAYLGRRTVAVDYVPISAYRKPTLRVSARPDKDLYLNRETVTLDIQTEYYFGLPVANTELMVSILRQPAYSFDEGVIEACDEQSDSGWGTDEYGKLVYTETLRTDERGRLTLRIPASRLIDPTGSTQAPVPFVVQVVAFTPGYETAKGTARFRVAPSEWTIRYEAGRWFGEVGTPFKYTVRVRDVRTGNPVQATLQWSAGEQLWEGRRQRFVRHASGTVRTNAEGVAQIAFTPHRPGDWLIQIETTDPRNHPVRAEDTVWVIQDAWWADVPSDYAQGLLEVRTQKRSYEPGESVELAIRSRARDAVFYVTLEGDRLYRSQVVRSRGALTRVTLPITAEQVPSAVVSVCLVHQKRMYQRSIPIRVGWKQSELQVSLRTDKPRYQPRETVQAEVQVLDSQGRPAQAELSLAVVDESIYTLREDDPKFLHGSFYTMRWNRVNTEFSAPWLALQGDKGESEAPRREFPDTAFWLPAIQTDEQGIARVKFRLPDSLTEWRLTAIGHTARSEFGYGKTTIKASKDLMVRLRLPMWLVEGDQTELSALVSNETDQPRTVQVALRTPENTYTARVTVPARGTQPVRWNYVAKTPGTQTFTVSARAEGTNLSDSEQRSLLVKPAVVYRSAARTQRVTGESTFVLNLPPDARLNLSRLELRAYPSLTALLHEPTDYLLDYEHLCAEQTVSRFLPALLWLRACEAEGISVPQEMRERIQSELKRGIQRLDELINITDRWSWFGDSESSLWLTLYVLEGLHAARSVGYEIPQSLYQRGLEGAGRQLSELVIRFEQVEPQARNMRLYQYRDLVRTLAYGLRTFSELGEIPESLRPRMLAVLKELAKVEDTPTQVDVLLTLLNWQESLPDQAMLRTLWSRLLQARQEDSVSLLWVPTEQTDWGWEWKSLEIQALILKALIRSQPLAEAVFGSEDRYREVMDKTALTLIINLQDRYWYSSRDVAMAVQALLEYNQRLASPSSGRPSRAMEVWVNDQYIGKVDIDTKRFSPIAQDLSRRLQPGENRIRVRVEGSPLLMTARLHYALPLDALGRELGSSMGQAVKMELALVDERTNSERTLRPNESIPVGSLVRVKVSTQLPVHVPRFQYSTLETPYAGGFAPIDTEYFLRGAWWSLDTAQLRDDRAIAYREAWYRGEPYRFSFIVRAELPGEYTILPAQLWGMYTAYEAYSMPLRVRITSR